MGKLAHRRAAGLAVLVLLLGLIPLVALAEVTEIYDTYPPEPGDTCPKGGDWPTDHVGVNEDPSGAWGTAEGTGTSIEVTLNEGYELIVCVKSGNPAAEDDGAEEESSGREFYRVTYEEDVEGEPITQVVAHSSDDLSHWSYRVVTTPTTEPTTPPTEPTQPTTALGAIVIEKVSNSGTGTFQFESPQLDGFALTTTATGEVGKVWKTFPGLQAGTYSVTEVPPTPTSTPQETRSWTMSASCSNGDNPSAITLEAGETVTCTFVNTLSVVAGIQVTTTTAPATTTTAAIAASTLPFTGSGGDLMAVPVAMAVVAIGLIALLGATRPEEESIGR
jgi:hypothetical protein